MPANIFTDLQTLNLQFLMILREYARHHPIEAAWQFDLKECEIKRILNMTVDQLKELASCGRAVLTILPTGTSANAPLNIIAALSVAGNEKNETGRNA